MGRKSSLSKAKAKKLLEHIKEGGSLRSFKELNQSTVFRWLEVSKWFREQYAQAREIQAFGWADEIIDIADEASRDTKTVKTKSGEEYEVADHEWINRSRLRVDSRKWLLSKLLPKKYGDKAEEGSDKPTEAITINVYPEGEPARYVDSAGSDKKIA